MLAAVIAGDYRDRAADLEAEVARLVDLGATRGRRFEEAGEKWVTMLDPEGNEFCIQPAG